MIHVGDPCYLNEEDGHDNSNYTKDWSQFCDWFFKNQDKFQNAKVPYDAGHEGKAIIVGGFGGDGTYPVYMRRGKGYFGEITTQILIDFNYEVEDEEETEDEEAAD